MPGSLVPTRRCGGRDTRQKRRWSEVKRCPAGFTAARAGKAARTGEIASKDRRVLPTVPAPEANGPLLQRSLRLSLCGSFGERCSCRERGHARAHQVAAQGLQKRPHASVQRQLALI